MNDDLQPTAGERGAQVASGYHAPTITYLGDLAELTTQKTVGAADGSTFLGLDIGSI